MAYTTQPQRLTTIKWPGQSAYQFFKNQTTWTKHIKGTPWTDQPYLVSVSFLAGQTRTPNSGSNPYETCNGGTSQSVNGRVSLDYYGLKPRAQNRARAKFVSQLRESRSASIGSALGEWRSTLAMIAERAKKLYDAAKAVKRFDIVGAGKALSSSKRDIYLRNWRSDAKNAADLWLELHFGWVPLLKDIHDGCQVISSPVNPPVSRITASARAAHQQGFTKVYDSGGSSASRRYLSGLFESYCGIRGKPELVNPNLELAERLGLVNPAVVAWELFPFSFLVDHVVNIGNFLAMYSDALAWSITDSSTSTLSVCRDGTQKSEDAIGTAFPLYRDYKQAFGAVMQRTVGTGLPAVELTFTNPLERLGVERGATYIALLAQTLKSF